MIPERCLAVVTGGFGHGPSALTLMGPAHWTGMLLVALLPVAVEMMLFAVLGISA